MASNKFDKLKLRIVSVSPQILIFAAIYVNIFTFIEFWYKKDNFIITYGISLTTIILTTLFFVVNNINGAKNADDLMKSNIELIESTEKSANSIKKVLQTILNNSISQHAAIADTQIQSDIHNSFESRIENLNSAIDEFEKELTKNELKIEDIRTKLLQDRKLYSEKINESFSFVSEEIGRIVEISNLIHEDTMNIYINGAPMQKKLDRLKDDVNNNKLLSELPVEFDDFKGRVNKLEIRKTKAFVKYAENDLTVVNEIGNNLKVLQAEANKFTSKN